MQVYRVNYTIRDGIMKYDPVSAEHRYCRYVLSTRTFLFFFVFVFFFSCFFLFLIKIKNYDIFRGGLFKFLINRN